MSDIIANTSRPRWARRKSQRGIVLIWVLISMVAILGVAAFAVDADYWYERRAEAQRVADAAALVYAYTYSTQGQSAANTAFANIINAAGYSSTDTTNNYVTNPYKSNPYWFNVHIARTEHQVFSGMVGVGAQAIDANSTSEYIEPTLMTFPPSYFGVAQAAIPVILQVNGPSDNIREGDLFSSSLDYNGNPNQYNQGFQGYQFQINIPSTYYAKFGSQVQIQIYDPQIHDTNSQTAVLWPYLDEIRDNTSSITFTLKDQTDATTLATDTYGMPYSTSSNQENAWITPPGFTVTLPSSAATSTYTYNLWIKMTAGSDQDGFLLRAGPPNTNLASGPTVSYPAATAIATADTIATTDPIYTAIDPATGNVWYVENNNNKTYAQNPTGAGGSFASSDGKLTWHDVYADGGQTVDGPTEVTANPSPENTGITIAGVGRLPIIFTSVATATLDLGTVPTGATQVTVQDFDAGDEGGSTSLYYTCTSLSGQQWPGTLTADGMGETTVINLPTNYTAGLWQAHYTTVPNDMSTWQFSYVGPPNGSGSVGLIATSNDTLD